MKKRFTWLFAALCVFSLIAPAYASVYFHGDPHKKAVAITFDDGPNGEYTERVLDVLRDKDAKATFFVIGKFVELFPDTARRIVEEGHAIGNHTYRHPDLRFQSRKVIGAQLVEAERVISNITGAKPRIFRPPYGGKSPKVLETAADMGFVIVEWSVSGKNGDKEIKAERIVRNVLNKVKNGSIILLHDGNRITPGFDRSQVVKALFIIIDELRARGYKIVTVPELLGISNENEIIFSEYSR
ncbi:MAG: polysaccharide deacetylase family protein [Candidatus Omnitrophota bacterium]